MKPALKHWLLPGMLGCTIVGVLFWLAVGYVRLRPLKEAARSAALPPAIMVGEGSRNDDLLKIEPLFLPTKYNASLLSLPAQVRQEPGSMSFAYPPRLTIGEASGGVPLPEPIPLPPTPAQALDVGQPANPWPEMARQDFALPRFEPRAARLEVRAAESGELVLAQDIAPGNLPAVPADWGPLEFLVAVDAAGLVGAPVAVRSLAPEEVQGVFRNFLARDFHLGARLPSGFYAITVGP